jgi:heme/copper-type cytochrome/quinol oxidase subunit 4
MRCIYEGSEFQWMNTWGVSLLGEERAMRIMGNGLEGHFLIVFLLAVLFTVIIFGLIRRPNDPLVKMLTVVFAGAMVAKEIMLSLAYGDQYQIAGETFRLQLNYSILGPALSLIIFGLALFWVYQNKLIRVPEATNLKVMVIITVLIIPCFLFLRLGPQHGWTDIVGINLIYLQFTLLILNWMGFFKQALETEPFNFQKDRS